MAELDKICALIEKSAAPAAYICDGECRIVCVNDSFVSLVGFDEDDLLGQVAGDVLNCKKSELVPVKERIAEGTPFDCDLHASKKSGQDFALGLFAIPFVNGSESVPFTVAIAREKLDLGDPLMDNTTADLRGLIGEALAIVQAS